MTFHGNFRLRTRLRINKKSFKRIKRLALKQGLTHAEAKGKLNKYYDHLYLRFRTANNVRLYSNHVWIFAGNSLITIYAIPQALSRLAKKALQKKQTIVNNKNK